MIIDKVPWLNHDNSPIWSVDIDPDGTRLLTAGSDHKIKVWALAPVLSRKAEKDPAQNKLLATISDHLSAVNVAKFSPKGHFIASGSDDKLVLIHQLLPGTGHSTFGSKDAPNIENWRQAHIMRGHNSNVSDIAWCPDGSKLATSSLDNNVIIWDAHTGRQITVLAGHEGNVKGVAWDPFDHFLASHGDADGVIIWNTTNKFSLERRVTEPWPQKMGSAAFHTKTSWSPDGQYLCGVVAFQGAIHQAPIIHRNTWQSEFQLCGHRNYICVSKFNPRMFSAKEIVNDDDEVYHVCAIGSMDKGISVWNLNSKTALMVVTNAFRGCVMDLVWTANGQTLIACCYDGTVATITFQGHELGHKVSQKVFDDLVHKLYGEDQAQKNQDMLLEAELMDIDHPAPAHAQLAQEPARQPATPAAAPAAAAAAQPAPAPAPAPVRAAATATQRASALDARLETRADGVRGAAGAVGAAGPSQQGAKKRIQPAPTDNVAIAATAAAAARPAPAATRPVAGTAAGTAAGRVGASALQPAQPASRPGADPAGATTVTGSATLLPLPPPLPSVQMLVGKMHVPGSASEEQVDMIAGSNLQQGQGRVEWRAGTRLLWFDTFEGAVCQCTCNPNFAAVCLTRGDLLLYSAGGRLLHEPMGVNATVLLAHDDAWAVMLLSVHGRVRIFDVRSGDSKLSVSVADIVEANKSPVLSMKFTNAGLPLVILQNRQVWVYCKRSDVWKRVAGDAPRGSVHETTIVPLQGAGELSRLQAEAAAAHSPRQVLVAAHTQPASVQKRNMAAVLEINIAASRSLGSAVEWKRWMVTYVRMLANEGKEVKLREVIDELLGPVPGSRRGPYSDGDPHAWRPTELGFDKRTFLRTELLKEIARPRTIPMQKLVQEVSGVLQQIAAHQAHAQGQEQQPAVAGGGLAGNMGAQVHRHGTGRGAGGQPQQAGAGGVTGVTGPGGGGGLSWLHTGA